MSQMKKDPIPVTAGAGSRWTGWTKKITDVVDQVAADIKGLQLRLSSPTRPGIPTCYRGEKLFVPEDASFLLDTAQDGVTSNLVNYVLRDGVPFSIPVKMTGDGVFVPDSLKVHFKQRLWVPSGGAPVWMNGGMSSQLTYTGATRWEWTTKFSLFPSQPASRDASTFWMIKAQPCAVNYFWNVVDTRNNRKLADDWVSSVMLLPGSPMAGFGSLAPTLYSMVDGDFFRFDCPWLFERDSQVEVRIWPINPVVQFDSSISGTDVVIGPDLAGALPAGYGFDDREGGRRNQSVLVAAEFHGYRYQTMQDAMRAGALTRY